jgi:hypothetical protein
MERAGTGAQIRQPGYGACLHGPEGLVATTQASFTVE